MDSRNEHSHNDNRGHEEITLVFQPVSGGTYPERSPKTSLLRQVVNLVLQKLNAQNAQNVQVQRKKDSAILNLDATLAALGLDSGDQLRLSWQTSGGMQ